MAASKPSVLASAPLFAALGDPTRLRLVQRLSEGEAVSIAGLTEGSGMTRQAVTKHLRVLSEAGLVNSLRVGREHVWELDRYRIEAAKACLDDLSAQWDRSLARLQRLVEE